MIGSVPARFYGELGSGEGRGDPLTEEAANLLIHGHDMADGTMFDLLVHYQRSGYIEKHPEIRFNTLWEAERYLIFAVLRTMGL